MYAGEKKDYQEKLFAHYQLSERIPKKNFYRRLKEVLDLYFLYDLSNGFYGGSGQKSIDSVMFIKVLAMFVEKGMVSDNTQAIDSAPVKSSEHGHIGTQGAGRGA